MNYRQKYSVPVNYLTSFRYVTVLNNYGPVSNSDCRKLVSVYSIRFLILIFFLSTAVVNSQNLLDDISFHQKKNTNLTTSEIFSSNSKAHLTSLADSLDKSEVDSLRILPVNADTTKKTKVVDVIDSSLYSKHGYLLNDDPEYNKKSPLWKPILGTFVGNLFTAAANKYILRTDWCNISIKTIENNWDNGWEWDADRFGINFFAHPYSGAMAFNHGRVEGYNFWESIPFAFGSSLMWEQFMENTRPSYNDLINTTLSGVLLGEILYRLSSSFLDDRITGSKRVVRELIAGILNTTRFTSRLESGKLTRVTKKDIYQREPLQAAIFLGMRNMNHGTSFWNGDNSAEVAMDFSYGDPLEERSRKPFDYFKFRFGFSFGAGKKIVNNIMGYGLLAGKNIATKNNGLLYGIFQTYDYWDNDINELGTVGIGGAIIHRVNIGKSSDITSHVHFGIIPMAGIKSPVADSIGERNYDYAGGLQGMLESSINIGGRVNLSVSYFIYGLHIYVGNSGNYIVGIFRPRIAVNLIKDLYVGFEFLQHGKDGYLYSLPNVHVRNNEQRLFIAISGGYFGIP